MKGGGTKLKQDEDAFAPHVGEKVPPRKSNVLESHVMPSVVSITASSRRRLILVKSGEAGPTITTVICGARIHSERNESRIPRIQPTICG